MQPGRPLCRVAGGDTHDALRNVCAKVAAQLRQAKLLAPCGADDDEHTRVLAHHGLKPGQVAKANLFRSRPAVVLGVQHPIKVQEKKVDHRGGALV